MRHADEESERLQQRAGRGPRARRRRLPRRHEEGVAGVYLEPVPQVISRVSDVGRKAQHMLIRTAAAGDPLTKDALSGRLEHDAVGARRPGPTSLEVPPPLL